MSYSEQLGPCDIGEYYEGEPERLNPDELIADEVYMLMTALDTINPEMASKHHARVERSAQDKGGLFVVSLSLLDEHYAVELETEGRFDAGGLWVDIADSLILEDMPTASGYLRNLEDEMDDVIRKLLYGLNPKDHIIDATPVEFE